MSEPVRIGTILPGLLADIERRRAARDMIERLKARPAPKVRGPTRFDPEHDPDLQDEFTTRDLLARADKMIREPGEGD
jgi:hypothetical protein